MRPYGEAVRLITQTLNEIEHRIAWWQFERGAAGLMERFPSPVPRGSLGHRSQCDVIDPESGKRLARRRQLPFPAVHDHEIRPRRGRFAVEFLLGTWVGARRFIDQPLETPAEHFPHHAKIIARGE